MPKPKVGRHNGYSRLELLMLRPVKYSSAYAPLTDVLPTHPEIPAFSVAAVPQARRANDSADLCCPSLVDGLRSAGAAVCRLGRQAGQSIRSQWHATQRKPPSFVPFDDPRSYEEIQDDRQRQWSAVYASLLNNEHRQ